MKYARPGPAAPVAAGQTVDATLTSKGQTTIPKEIRDRLGLRAGDRMTFSVLSDGTVVMRAKTKRLADLVGVLKRPGQPEVGIDEMSPFKSTGS